MQNTTSNRSLPAPSGYSGRRILRLPNVELLTGFKRAHIYSLMTQGRFPKSVRLGTRAVGWDSTAIEKWVEDRISGDATYRSNAVGEGL
ncbi:AlpA family transcriptional regulator [Pseudomonas viridiflava]|uniref:AlpA family transcriptional regulator n=1 Tax=Pseudomonas viridiflava TaxID=33069 RepID=UPI000EFC577B|nr:AlpA family transcriptional regulator [Pseudomonas viridiflava]